MQKSVESYIDEMMKMHQSRAVKPAIAPTFETEVQKDEEGGLLVQVTTLKGLYAVPSARVSVLKGEQVIDADQTDQSGRTKVFSLPAPSKSLSATAGANALPYEIYQVEVMADGFAPSLIRDVPVFSTITSIQPVDLILLSASNGKEQISDGAGEYPL